MIYSLNRTALSITLFLALALLFFGSLGCQSVDVPDLPEVEVFSDVPPPPGFSLSFDNPVPRTEKTDGGFRFARYAFESMGSFGKEECAAFYLGALEAQGWELLGDQEIPGSATWVGRWRKGQDPLTLTYSEKSDPEDPEKITSRVLVEIRAE